MSLYNNLFGINEIAPALLRVLGFSHADIPRFRDCFLHGSCIVVHTRTGGGNRLWYESEEKCRKEYPEEFLSGEAPAGPWNSDLRKHVCYLKDEDDDFDCTYANFYFSFPKEHEETLTFLALDHQGTPPAERWQALIKSMKEATPDDRS